MLFLVEDNGYAISVPVEVQTPGGDISRIVEGFPGLRVLRCDGTDYLASYRHDARSRRARPRAATGRRSSTRRSIRPYSHSLSDDEKLYKTPAEREAEARRDPLVRMRQFLKHEGLATDEELADIAQARSSARSTRRPTQALDAPKPDPATAADFVFSPDVDPDVGRASRPSRGADGAPDTMVAAINRTLKDEMARNPRIVVFGEDVADAQPRRGAGRRSPARAACSR